MKNYIFILVFSLCFLKLDPQTIKGYTKGTILKNPQNREEIVGVKFFPTFGKCSSFEIVKVQLFP
jgi:hypothetical protein